MRKGDGGEVPAEEEDEEGRGLESWQADNGNVSQSYEIFPDLT